MPDLTWNEVRDRSIAFSSRWAGTTSESAESHTFWDEFFRLFGRDRRVIASFEFAVENVRGHYNHIDLLWPGTALVEHKSAGENLTEAQSQAFDYIQDLIREGRNEEIPRFVIVSDFTRFALFDLEPGEQPDLPVFAGHRYTVTEFKLGELHNFVRHFAFLKGERQVHIDPEDPANQKAYDRMCLLHDKLAEGGLLGADLERLLVRVLFCLFAEDTEIFEPNAFQSFILNNTREDGSDLGARLNELFDLLNTPMEARSHILSDEMACFPHVNGQLFAERLSFPPFTREMRNALIEASRFMWSRVSPAVFGSLFQGVMLPRVRRQQGAHYTSERDIMRVIRALFLDNLRAEFQVLRADRSTRQISRLEDFHRKLRELRFLDPACGCGNFLVVSYRELRLLELDVLKELNPTGQQVFNLRDLVLLDVDQFNGIELGEWAVRISEVALWLMDHQMNQLASVHFGQTFKRLPLSRSPHIVQGNALTIDWGTILPPSRCAYVLGNPPYAGHHLQDQTQKHDQQLVLAEIAARGVLDYVCNWFLKAVHYIQGTQIVTAFVSTSSITQGEQAGMLWNHLLSRYQIKILFAHRTFPWISEARGRAHVDVVIIGFGAFNRSNKPIYDYGEEETQITVSNVRNIGPYLMEGPDRAVTTRATPICDVPKMSWGNKPTDGGHLILSRDERQQLINDEPQAKPLIRRYMSGGDFIDANERYCLWLTNVSPDLLRRCPRVLERVERVRAFRLSSKAKATRNFAAYPTLFRQISQPSSNYLAVPEVSSERRAYIPIAFVSKDFICSNTVQIVPDAAVWHFGVLSSSMHMAWMRVICGRLESRYRYSNTLVYNNFPWPVNLTERRKRTVQETAQVVLNAREQYLSPHGTSTLADLYDPRSMPESLLRAHAKLDRAVEQCYRANTFQSDADRFGLLFSLYETLCGTNPDENAPRYLEPADVSGLSELGDTDLQDAA